MLSYGSKEMDMQRSTGTDCCKAEHNINIVDTFGTLISVLPCHCKQLEMPVHAICHYPGIPISHHYLRVQ